MITCDDSIIVTTEDKSYSKTLKGTSDFKKIIQEARNEEKAEEREKEKRSRNFIVHGLEEVGIDNDAIKKTDAQTIARLLEIFGVTSQPESYTRLGQQEKDKKKDYENYYESERRQRECYG